jgi:purine-binding chemotaxis protein CheW
MSVTDAHDGAARGKRQFATFFIHGVMFGVEVLQVQEVLRYQTMTGVPLAPDVVEGLINLRGQIVMAVDMRRRLELPPRDAARTPMNMIVRSDDGAVSLLVDEIGDVVDVEDAIFERPPANITAVTRELTRGVYKLKDRLLLVLDVKQAVTIGDRPRLPAATAAWTGEAGRQPGAARNGTS